MSGGKEEGAGVLGSAGGDGDVNEYVVCVCVCVWWVEGGRDERKIKEAGGEFKNRITI